VTDADTLLLSLDDPGDDLAPLLVRAGRRRRGREAGKDEGCCEQAADGEAKGAHRRR
jgi:hypothetical protein